MKIYSIEEIKDIVSVVSARYEIESVYLFGSYARREATKESDLDFVVTGKQDFKRTLVLAFAEELRTAFQKDVDVFEIHEIDVDSALYKNMMRDRVRVV